MAKKPLRPKVTNPALLGMRTHNGHLQTAVNTFRHPDGRTVTLVGIEHIGEAGYYADLRKIVDEAAHAGAQVRYEILLDKDDTDAARNDAERAGLAALNEQINTRFEVFRALGLDWIEQKNSAMAPDPNWVKSDVRAIEMVRMHGPVHITQIPQLTGPKRLLSTVETLKERRSMRRLRLLRASLTTQVLSRGAKLAKREPHGWWDTRIVYAWRECVEALKILEQNGDVIAIWAAPHMMGLSEALIRNQFVLEKTQWHTAIHNKDHGPIPLDQPDT